jgi:hypothetical protein
LGSGVFAPPSGFPASVFPVSGLVAPGVAAVGVAPGVAGCAPFPGFAASFGAVAVAVVADGAVVVVRSLAAREARPRSVILGIRIRGMNDPPSGMAQS